MTTSARPRRSAIWIGALAVFAGSFLIRMLEFAFHNDHFEFLSLGTEIVNGAVPGVDFFDATRPLQQYLTAAGLWLFGHQLLFEAIFCVAALSIGAALVFALGLQLTGAVSLGLIGATFVVAMLPRLYSYPKIIVPALGLLVCWRYIDRPSPLRLAAVSIVTAIAFYLRFDYGALFGVAAATALLVRHWGAWRECALVALRFALVVVLLCAPYVLFQVAWGELTSGPGSGRLTHLLRGDDVVSLAVPELPEERPLVSFRPAGPLSTVRWRSEIDRRQWPALEVRYALRRVRMADDQAWQYVLTDPSPATLMRLMADPAVEGVTNIDPQGRVGREPPWTAVRRWLRIPVIESPLLKPEMAAIWLYDVLFLTPLAAAAVLLVRAARRRVAPGEAAKVIAVIAIGVLFNIFQIRGNLDSRLPDVIVPAALLWVWMAGIAAAELWRGNAWRRISTGAALTVALLALWLVVDGYAGFVSHLEATELFSTPGKVARRLSGTIAGLRRDPLDQFAPPGSRGLPALTRYVNRCTSRDDFLVVIGYLPEVYFYADRRIGAGNVQYHANLGAAPEQQQVIVSRLRQQRVPIVILPVNEAREFEESYPTVKQYIDERYALAQESGFGEGRAFRVLVDRQATPTHTDEELGLPCFKR
jgi:hypothetical protein